VKDGDIDTAKVAKKHLASYRPTGPLTLAEDFFPKKSYTRLHKTYDVATVLMYGFILSNLFQPTYDIAGYRLIALAFYTHIKDLAVPLWRASGDHCCSNCFSWANYPRFGMVFVHREITGGMSFGYFVC
jgi:hypothetical protein